MDTNFQENFQQRIRILMQNEGLNAKQFAEKSGMNQTAVSHLLSGRNKPSYDTVIGIKNAFPNLNTDWLLFGQQPMYKDNTIVNSETPLSQPPVSGDDTPSLFSENWESPSTGTETAQSAPQSTVVNPENPAPENRVEHSKPENNPEYTTLEASNPPAGPALIREIVKEPVHRKIARIVVFYDDQSYEDFQH